MIGVVVDEAVAAGARRGPACALLGLSVRTVERWRHGAPAEDARQGPRTPPAHALSPAERATLVAVLTSPAYRDLSPHQIVPRLADAGQYLASEATCYRVLRATKLQVHRGRAQAPVRRRRPSHTATGPNQVWSWDITYLPTPVRGQYHYLYLMLDVWSRKIVGAAVHATEAGELAAALFRTICADAQLDPQGIVLHADNGGPMKGATMVATLERLGVLPSFSRPHVSNDNAFSEALFRTLKYRPDYPRGPFATVATAQAWVTGFVRWYNTEHQHSAIRFVTPEDRHTGREPALLAQRQQVYLAAHTAHPARWARQTRNWQPVAIVDLNPPPKQRHRAQVAA